MPLKIQRGNSEDAHSSPARVAIQTDGRKGARNRTTVLAEGLLDGEAEAITRKPIETNCATRSAIWFRSLPTAVTTLVVKVYCSGYGHYCCRQACGQRDPLPTLLTDIVEEPMPALDEMSGLEPAHGIRNPQQRDLTKADIAVSLATIRGCILCGIRGKNDG